MIPGMGRPKSTWVDLPPRMCARRSKKGARYYYQAGGKKIPLGTNLLEAKEEWARLEHNGPKLLFPKVARLYRAAMFQHFSASTKDHYERALRNLEVFLRKYTLEQLQSRHVKLYLRKRSKKGAAIFEKRVGSALFNWARGEGLTNAPNPFTGIKFSRAEQKSFEPTKRKKQAVPEDVFWATYGRGDEVLQDAMDLAHLSGQRPSDLLKARRTDILEGIWTVVQQKTGATVRIKVEGELQDVIERILTRPRKVQSVYIISDRRGQRVLYGSLNRRFRAARGDSSWQFREIRAKTASDSPDLKTAQELLGHESELTTVIYRRGKGAVSPLKRRI